MTGGINVAGAPGSGTGAESRRGEGKREEQQDFGPWVDHVASPLHLATAPAAATEAETAKRRGEQEERGEREGGRGKHDTPGTQSVCRWDPGERESDRTVLAKMRVETADIHSSSSDIHSSSSSQQHPVLSLPRQAHVPKEVASAAAGAAGGLSEDEFPSHPPSLLSPSLIPKPRQIQARTDTLTDRASGGAMWARKPIVPPRSELEEPEAGAPETLEILGESSDAKPRAVSCASAATDAASAEAEVGTEAPAAAAAAATTKRLPVWRQRQRQRQQQQTASLADEYSAASAVECAHQNPGGGCGTEGDAVSAGGDRGRGAVQVPSSPARGHLADAQKPPATPSTPATRGQDQWERLVQSELSTRPQQAQATAPGGGGGGGGGDRAEQVLSGPLGALLAIAAANTLNPLASPAHCPPSPPPSPPPPPIASSSATGVVASAVSAMQTPNLRD